MKQGGFVLLTVMILILTAALLVLSLMKGVWLYSKTCRQMTALHRSLQALETMAATLDFSQSACRDTEINPNGLMEHIKKGQGCLWRINQQRYRYIIADLGLYPCLPIAMNHIQYSSHQWYLTVIDLQFPHRVMQWRLAKLSDEVAVCELSVHHFIREGIMTWRFLG